MLLFALHRSANKHRLYCAQRNISLACVSNLAAQQPNSSFAYRILVRKIFNAALRAALYNWKIIAAQPLLFKGLLLQLACVASFYCSAAAIIIGPAALLYEAYWLRSSQYKALLLRCAAP